MLRAALIAALLAAAPAAAETRARVLEWSELEGWAEDDPAEALAAFRETCPDMPREGWGPLCALAFDVSDAAARRYFEALFRPVLIEDGARPLFTGYFEPEVDGALAPGGRYATPIYRRPEDLPRGGPSLTRAEIAAGALEGRGLEVAWLDDPVEAFFLQLQGSGRIRLPDGGVIRVGFGGDNGHARRSVGREMERRGLIEEGRASAAAIRSWVRLNPEEGQAVLNHDPSYAFFREVGEVPAEAGPLGAMNRSITAGRTVAVDPAHVPLGAPVWIETDAAEPLRRLMVAQDTGSAIKGAQRADVFVGTGREAGRRAGRMRGGGRMMVVLPIRMAWARAPAAPWEPERPAAPAAAAEPAAPEGPATVAEPAAVALPAAVAEPADPRAAAAPGAPVAAAGPAVPAPPAAPRWP